jgi:RimJ/RimL family protein N-acetyltransferase
VWFDVHLRGSVARLRPLDPSDCAALVAAANEDRATYGFTWVPATLAESAAHEGLLLEELAARRMVPLVVELVADGRVVGASRFMDLDWLDVPGGTLVDRDRVPPRAVEIGGTWYAASVQRTAVNTECKLLMLSHAFDVWGVERVCFKTDARNERSRRAIERIGAQSEGVRRRHMLGADGLIRDSAYYSVVRQEWPACRSRLVERLDSQH